MKHLIMSVYDKAVEAYLRPFTTQSLGQATRVFMDETKREGSEFNMHPEDYALFHIADFYDNDATIENKEPKCIARAHEITQVIAIKAGLKK